DPVYQKLTGPGGDFEIVEENVLGQTMPVFRHRYRSLPELFLDSQKHGDREFMVDGDRRVTYREHCEMVKAITHLLATEYGIGKGDRVAIFAENSIEWDVAFWSLMHLGAIGVAMNGWWTGPEFMHAWRLSEPKLLLGDAKRLARLGDEDLQVPVLDMAGTFIPNYPASGEKTPELPVVAIDEDDPALIMFTSGTTGKAKGAVISHRTEIGFTQCTLFATAYTMAQWGLTLADRPPGVTLGTSPFFHISGLGGLLLLTRANGDKVVLYHGSFDPDRALSLIDREKVTTWTALGGMGPKIISCPNLDQYDLSSVTALIFGGSPVSESVQEALRTIF
ncbi:MAG: class I adenylate-forming enzyme family protein, partial [Oceanisphaera sp.]|nr:class I adenylate-forming enzyme family protein [Oceanisphaera sp.]